MYNSVVDRSSYSMLLSTRPTQILVTMTCGLFAKYKGVNDAELSYLPMPSFIPYQLSRLSSLIFPENL